ncbi:DUF1593 domain-containing protein [Mariniphaga sediminis]|uniref:DUF1593 domain-containing protein n=1 Tax=Mariniphaga sediminis TaxID=1628158 RepID=A0A399D6F2_9BACT|nr:DUF1593 domain-containing protein [Mariniphaga sediminis]RIH67189.1 DUF1593 domain-containing protein [Mariniphaga sediminis]
MRIVEGYRFVRNKYFFLLFIQVILFASVLNYSCKNNNKVHKEELEGLQEKTKTRVIVTTDGEGDDRMSLVRFLLYTNEFDVKGLIRSSSKFHWKGRGDVPGYKWKDDAWIENHIEAYACVYPNLLLHDENYQSPEELKKQVLTGNIDLPGDMEFETPGSNHIADVLLDPDTSAIWLQAWGGSNTIARALKTIEEKYPERKTEVSRKARLFLIMFQDSTYHSYIRHSWPELTVIVSTAFESIGYPWRKRVPEELQQYYKGTWMNKSILFNHGELCNIYKERLYKPNRRTGDFISEGDSPSFMHEIQNGLSNTENPSWGGWGGRFKREGGLWVSAFDDNDKFKTIYRWIPAFQNDFAAKADWCIMSYDSANHHPVVKISSKENLIEKSGKKVIIDASMSEDPDGDNLSFYWWQYIDAGTYKETISLKGSKEAIVSFLLPHDIREGETIHIICEITDDGIPALTRYKRIVITCG